MNTKWAPFNAVAPGGFMISEVMREKNKVSMPTLSEDQMLVIQEKILEAYNNQEVIKIKYFRAGNIYINEGIIGKIDNISHKILFIDGFSLFFSQIVEIC